jgi:hypothetical protein
MFNGAATLNSNRTINTTQARLSLIGFMDAVGSNVVPIDDAAC